MNSVSCIGVLFTLFLTCTSSCSRYVVSINENVVYSPPKLVSDYSIPDPYLKSCLQSTISELHITSQDQLTKLICPTGDISDLSGIEQFPKIEYLGLSANKIQNIGPLAELKDLRQIDISDNQIQDFTSLKDLENLVLLDTKGNSNADCKSLLFAKAIKSLVLPNHCL